MSTADLILREHSIPVGRVAMSPIACLHAAAVDMASAAVVDHTRQSESSKSILTPTSPKVQGNNSSWSTREYAVVGTQDPDPSFFSEALLVKYVGQRQTAIEGPVSGVAKDAKLLKTTDASARGTPILGRAEHGPCYRRSGACRRA